jgi:hypothetical protein
MPDLNREERLRQLLEQSQALREQRPRALQADLDSQLLGNLGYNFAQIGQSFSPTTPEKKDYMPSSSLSSQLAEQEKGLGSEMKNLQEAALYDPTSPISKLASSAYAKEHNLNPEELGSISAKELASVPNLMKPAKQERQMVMPEDKTKAALDLAQKKADIDLKRQKELIDYRTSKIPEAQQKDMGNVDIKALPEEERDVVKGLAKANADKISIANQISGTLKILDDPKVSKEQKISQGRQMLKVLNSTQGKDAVGAEEAKRLGSYLESSFGINWNSPRALGDFGMNLEGFREQAALTNKALVDSINANQAEIQKRYAQYGVQRQPVGVSRPERAQGESQRMYDTQTPSQLSKDQIRQGMLKAAQWMKSSNPADKEKGQKLFQKLKAMGGM